MGYYIRVLGTRLDQPSLDYLQNSLAKSKHPATVQLETGTEKNWEQLILTHRNGPKIALIEYNPVVAGELGQDELEEFISEIDHYKPASAAQWLKGYLPRVKAIYALQLLSGTDVDDGWSAVHALQGAIWAKAGGILQADSEGFTNEDGCHILWQFNTGAAGKWRMAVLDGEKWTAFEMELDNLEHREGFFKGHVPQTARLL